jgi:hypothetical protein
VCPRWGPAGWQHAVVEWVRYRTAALCFGLSLRALGSGSGLRRDAVLL